MEIFKVRTPLLDSNMYIITEQGRGIIVDPYWDEKTDALLKNLDAALDLVYLTHEHYDHISGVKEIQERYTVPVFCSKPCADRIADERGNFSRYFEAFFILQGGNKEYLKTVCPTKFRAGDVFEKTHVMEWQGHVLRFFETPGHSEGSSSLLIDEKVLFSGDSLASDAKIVTRFPGGDVQKLREITFPLYSALPRDIWVYPGHCDLFQLKDADCRGDDLPAKGPYD